MAEGRDAFYVGYKPQAEPELAAWLRRRLLVLLLALPIVAALLVVGQSRFDDSTHEFGIVGEYRGRLEAAPYPYLAADAASDRPRLLVGVGKLGADEVDGMRGREVRFEGTRIYRDDQEMIEIAPGSVVAESEQVARAAPGVSGGAVELVGEIVDSKCYLGVMKPGRGKPHRSCAARCISGGVPPILLVTDSRGERHYLLLVGEDGRALNSEVLEFVGEPLAIAGEIVEESGLRYLRAEPAAFRRLEG